MHSGPGVLADAYQHEVVLGSTSGDGVLSCEPHLTSVRAHYQLQQPPRSNSRQSQLVAPSDPDDPLLRQCCCNTTVDRCQVVTAPDILNMGDSLAIHALAGTRILHEVLKIL